MSRPTPPSSTSAALGAFAHLPAYEFDYDYRGDSIRPAATTPSPLTSPPSTSVPPPLATATVPRVQPERPQYSPLVDDFDSYMFPDVESPAYPDDDPRHLLYSPSDSTDTTTLSTLTDQQRLQRAHTDAPAASPRPRQPVDWRAVDAATLYSPNATSMDPDKLYTGYSSQVVLVFVPRHAVELAGLVYGKVAHLLQQAGARLVFITAWAPDQALTFLSRFERVSPFPGALVCDPHAALFSAFGFTRSPLRALFATPKVSAPMRQGMRNAFSTVSYRAANRDIATTPVSSKRLKCGAVVLPSLRGYAKRPVLTYIAEEAAATGVACYLDVLTACGVNEAFVPEVDVAQVFARFNSMRVTSIKARVADEKEANRLKAQKQRERGSRKTDRRNTLKGS